MSVRLGKSQSKNGLDLSASAFDDLTSVTVPRAFHTDFLNAQRFVQEYFSEKKESPQKGIIDISGERYILVRAASMSHEFFELMTSFYQDRSPKEARNAIFSFLYDMAHSIGRADARSFFTKLDVTDPIARLSAGPIHFAHTGWAYVHILPESHPTPDDNYYLIYDHPFSFEADTWRQNQQQTDYPVCIMSAGYSSGWCEESFGIPLVAAEIECRSKGDPHCRFIMAPPHKIKAHIIRYSQRPGNKQVDYGEIDIPEFFKHKRLEDELRTHRDHLEDLVKKRTDKLTKINRRLAREIARRREINKALQQSKAMFEAIYDQTFQLIGILDLKGNVIQINETALRFAGTTQERVVGATFWETPWWSSDHKEQTRLRNAIKKAARGQLVRFETQHQGKDGSNHIIDFSIKPIKDDGGKNIMLIAEGRDITALKVAMEGLKNREAQLQAQSTHLEEANIALKVILKQVEEKRKEDNENILTHVKQSVFPYIERLKGQRLNSQQKVLLGMLEANLNDITSPLISKLSSAILDLTPMEIKIAQLIKEGLTNKEIAELHNISPNTVSSHRFRIRTKLGLKKKGTNLRSYLLSLTK